MYINKYKQINIVPSYLITSVESQQEMYKQIRNELLSKIGVDNRYSYSFAEQLDYLPFEKVYEFIVVVRQEPLGNCRNLLEVEHTIVKDLYKNRTLISGNWVEDSGDKPQEPFYKKFNFHKDLIKYKQKSFEQK